MATITSNDVYVFSKTVSGVAAVDYTYLGDKMYALQEIEKVVGVFVSDLIIGDANIISWNDLSVTITKYTDTDVYLYVRSSTDTSFEGVDWYGPFFNDSNDISSMKGQYLQIMAVLLNKNASPPDNTPVIEDITASFYASSSAVEFYTRSYDIGFVPKHIVLTYNGTIPDDAMVQFAVSGFDSVDPNDYQVVEANKVVKLDELSVLSDKLKVMLSLFGSGGVGVTVSVSEFALLVSGDSQVYINADESSSSSSACSGLPEMAITLTWSGSGTKTFLGEVFTNGETKYFCPDTYTCHKTGSGFEQTADYWIFSPGYGDKLVMKGAKRYLTTVYDYQMLKLFYGYGNSYVDYYWQNNPAATFSYFMANQNVPTYNFAAGTGSFIADSMFSDITTASGVTIAWQRVNPSEWGCV